VSIDSMIATVAQAAPFTSLGSVDLKERELMVDLLILHLPESARVSSTLLDPAGREEFRKHV